MKLSSGVNKTFQSLSFSKTSKTKTLLALLLFKLLSSGCIIEGDKERPAPCGNIQITNPNCALLDPHHMQIHFNLTQLLYSDMCDEEIPVDVKIDIISSEAQPLAGRWISGTSPDGPTISFTSAAPTVPQVSGVHSYTFTGNVIFTNPVSDSPAPLPEITVTTLTSGFPGSLLSTDDYQFPCAGENTTPCSTNLQAFCHFTSSPTTGIAWYKFDICVPFTMFCRFTVGGYDLANTPITYTLHDSSGSIVSDSQALPGVDVPITFPNSNTPYSLQVNYNATGPINTTNGFNNLHIPGTNPINTTANTNFGQAIYGNTSDTNCTN